MTTALAVHTENAALTVYEVAAQKLSPVTVERATSKGEIIDRINEKSAAIADIMLFLRSMGPMLEKSDLEVVDAALARAYYRENRPVTLHQIALLAEQSIRQIENHLRFLGIALKETFSVIEASRVLSRIMED